MRMPSAGAPTSSRAAARLAATSRLASSATSATRSRGRMARQTSIALRAPAVSSGEKGPNTVAVGILSLIARPSGRAVPWLNDEGGHLAAAGGHVRQARRAEAREEAADAPAEEIRREVDEHVALDDPVGLAHRIGLAADRDPFLGNPSARRFAERARDHLVPRALV